MSARLDPTCRGSLILVNAGHPYCGLEPELAPVGGVLLERRAAALLERLMARMHGWDGIAAVSGWRPHVEQRGLWEQSLRDNGEDFTRRFVARPGHSEHETGLAIDLGLRGEPLDAIRPHFPDEGAARAFRRLAAGHGFVERYPAGKEHITGIAAEPWHFRYVGVPHAAIMVKFGFTLEEYHDFLRRFPYGGAPFCLTEGERSFEISRLTGAQTPPQTDGTVVVSGDNMGAQILTVWREGAVVWQ